MKNRLTVLDEMRAGDADDPFGNGMSWLWSVCEVINYCTDEEVPVECGYRPSLLAPGMEEEVFETEIVHDLLVRGQVTPEELVQTAKCLDRYINWCKIAGKDY